MDKQTKDGRRQGWKLAGAPMMELTRRKVARSCGVSERQAKKLLESWQELDPVPPINWRSLVSDDMEAMRVRLAICVVVVGLIRTGAVSSAGDLRVEIKTGVGVVRYWVRVSSRHFVDPDRVREAVSPVLTCDDVLVVSDNGLDQVDSDLDAPVNRG